MIEFGSALTDHMVTARWRVDTGWSEPTVSVRGSLPLDAAAVGLHYGQSVFEGLKAYRNEHGGMALFRPHAYSQRFKNSAARLELPQPTEQLFLECLSLLVRADGEALPDDPALSLYLRPLLIGSEPTLALRPARECLLVVTAFITGTYFSGSLDPIAVWATPNYVRTAPGGAGDAKWPGNYAPTFRAQAEAESAGCQQVVWLDAVNREQVEELGGMNLFFVRQRRDGKVAVTTPPLTGTILPGVTRDSLLKLGVELGYSMAEESISISEWREGSISGEITETIACGTAATVVSVGQVRTAGDEWRIGTGLDGPVTQEFRQAINLVQRGIAEDEFGWLYNVT